MCVSLYTFTQPIQWQR